MARRDDFRAAMQKRFSTLIARTPGLYDDMDGAHHSEDGMCGFC